MTGGQIKGKVSRANAWLCLYRPQCTARVIKAAIGEGERATDVATPQMHRDSNFQQLFKALRERLDEDFRYTQKQDNQKLLTELFTGSQQYFRELAAINGPYHYLNISEAILAGINKTGAIDQPSTTRLQTTVKTKNGEGFSLETSLKKLWLQEKPHIILLGDGGMGKTVSLIHLWETLLKNNQKNDPQTIPLFLTYFWVKG